MDFMNQQRLVSIVIPVYNGANFLGEAIRSALKQTHRNFEIIVVNDGSTDGGATREVALSFGSLIRYFEKVNGGCGSALNYGIEQMRGDYFSWLSHDDIYDSNKIERQLEELTKPENIAKVACCSYRILDDATNIFSAHHFFDVEELEKKPFYGLFRGAINGNCLLISKEVFIELGKFDESLRTTQDYNFFYRLLKRFNIVYHSDVLVTARIHSKQDTIANFGLAMQESDHLWLRFITESKSIGVFAYEQSPAAYWAKFANHLWQSPYPIARERVFAELRLALESQVPEQEDQPLVSVVLPFLKVDPLLLSAVKSAVEQTYKNMEIVLAANARVEDADFLEVQTLARENGRELRIIDASAERGASYARNRGLDAAKGEFIALLDSDDFWHPKKIDLQVAAMQGIPCEAVSTSYSLNSLDIKDFSPKSKIYYSARDYLLTLDKIFPTPSFMFRATDARFDERMHICEDMDFFSKMIGNGNFLELPYRLSVINAKSVYAWNVTDAYAARMGVCIAGGVATTGDEFEKSLFLTLCGVAISRGRLDDLQFVVLNWRRIIRLISLKYVARRFIRHLGRKIPGAPAIRVWLRRGLRPVFSAGSDPRFSSSVRGRLGSISRVVWRTLVPRRLESRIVFGSSAYRDLVALLENTRATYAGQIAQLELNIAEQNTISVSKTEQVTWFERKVAEQDIQHSVLAGQIADLEHTLIEVHVEHKSQTERCLLLEKTVNELQVEVATLRQHHAMVVDENSALKGQVTAFRIANNDQSALITGKLSLLDYTMQSLVNSTPGKRDSVAQGRAYLDLLERSLVGLLSDDPAASPWSESAFNQNIRTIGRDWPKQAFTMIGTVRMRNLRHLLERVIREDVRGDVIETGVWRGGACIYMRGILAAHDITDRTVWVADSFRGLPAPDNLMFPADQGDVHHTFDQLAVPLAEVKKNFERYGLLDEQVRFLEGWFEDTLSSAPIEQLALLRLDGDMYVSTKQALDALYFKLVPGGFVIVDDYILEPCRKAVEEFRTTHRITAELESVDGAAVFWRKAAHEAKASSVELPA